MSDDQKQTQATTLDMRELGATGLRRFSGFIYDEFLPELTGWKGVAVYKEMGSNDPTVAAVLFAIKMLCRRAKWRVKPQSQDGEDLVAAEFLETCMHDMSQTWLDMVTEVLSFLQYGHSAHEIIYKRRLGDQDDSSKRSKYNDGRIGWRKMPIRSQDTLYRWIFDESGGIRGVQQLPPPKYELTSIPIEKMLLFRTYTDKNNPEGTSILRGAYRPWYYKKQIENIEAIGIERDLAGYPVAFVPPELLSSNADPSSQKLLAAIKELVVNVRRNSQEGMVFPLAYDPQTQKPLYDFKLLSTGGTRQFDTNAIINRYDSRISMTALADFILLGQQQVGSFALASSKTNLFAVAIGAFLDIVADVFNRFAVPRLFKLNAFNISAYPEIEHGDIGSVDLNELGQYIQRLAASGAPLFPNNSLEKYLLEVASLPSDQQEDEEHDHTPEIAPELPSSDGKVTEIPHDAPPGSVPTDPRLVPGQQ